MLVRAGFLPNMVTATPKPTASKFASMETAITETTQEFLSHGWLFQVVLCLQAGIARLCGVYRIRVSGVQYKGGNIHIENSR